MANFTSTQGRYLAFIDTYTRLHGYPPAESEIAKAMCVSPPSVNQMVKTLERKGLISRQPGEARSIEILVPDEEIPIWGSRKPKRRPPSPRPGTWVQVRPPVPASPPGSLYVITVFLMSGPISEKFAGKTVMRVIEIRGDQTLEQLHRAIFDAFDRHDEHLYQFQFGKRPFDPEGTNYGIPELGIDDAEILDARTTKLDDLELKAESVFGYWFDFGDDWFHQVQVDRIEQAIPTVTYPRIVKRVGKSPPQYSDNQ